MKTIYDIQKGDEFWVIQGDAVFRYDYLCIMPSKNPEYETPKNYHIVINRFTARPERWYYTDLERELNKEYAYSYEDAKKELKRQKIEKLQDLLDNFDKYY